LVFHTVNILLDPSVATGMTLEGELGHLLVRNTQNTISEGMGGAGSQSHQATPAPDSAMFYFTTNQLQFEPEFLGRVKLVSSLASLAGIALYNFKLKDVPLKKMFTWVSIVGTALGMTQLMLITGFNRELGIPDRFFALGDSAILTVLGQLAFMPTLVLAAKICPEGLEATLFAGLMSVFNAGGVASGALGAALTEALHVTADDFDNLALLVRGVHMPSSPPRLAAGGRSETRR
jgi:hypothetical protein